MRPLTRIGLFAGILLAVFAAASLAGAAIDPGVDEPEEHAAEPHATPEGEEHGAHDGSESVATLPGLATAGAGYRLVPDRTRLPLGTRTGFSFRIVDEAGAVVQDFETEHARRMHLIVVRRDFAGFQHLHPEQRADGSWEVDIELDEAGAYRAFADFAVEGAVADARHRSVRRRTPSAPCRCRASPRRPASAADTRSRSTQPSRGRAPRPPSGSSCPATAGGSRASSPTSGPTDISWLCASTIWPSSIRIPRASREARGRSPSRSSTRRPAATASSCSSRTRGGSARRRSPRSWTADRATHR